MKRRDRAVDAAPAKVLAHQVGLGASGLVISTFYRAVHDRQFANLLYIDAPGTGFSYPLANDDGTKPDVGIDMDRDAGIFNRVVLRFLKRHPALQGNRVVIVGESYGGTRATLMLQDVFNYASLTSASAPYRDTQLSDELLGYFSSVFGTTTPNAVQIATKFGHQVLIEPVVVADAQQRHFTLGTPDAFDLNQCLTPTCMKTSPGQPTTCDVYNCDKPVRWSYFPTNDSRIATMPHTYVSGHSVSMRAPSELLSDVMVWYQASPH